MGPNLISMWVTYSFFEMIMAHLIRQISPISFRDLHTHPLFLYASTKTPVLSMYSFLLMSFPHVEAFWGFFLVILYEKELKEHPSSPLSEKNKPIITLS